MYDLCNIKDQRQPIEIIAGASLFNISVLLRLICVLLGGSLILLSVADDAHIPLTHAEWLVSYEP